MKKSNDGFSLVKSISIKTDSKMTNGESLRKIAEEFSEFISGYEFEAVVKEKGFTRFNISTQQIFEATGVIEYLLSDYEIVNIAATTIKKEIGGHGKAEKVDVLKETCKLLNIPQSHFEIPPKTSRGKTKIKDDETDATAVILTYLKQRGELA